MSKNRVAVFGAGPGGLSVALELAERGFEVDVFEPRAIGGKARSYALPGTGTDGRADLPADVGPHVLLGFYATLFDTMRRIPDGHGRTVRDHFSPADNLRMAWGDVSVPFKGDIRPGSVASVTKSGSAGLVKLLVELARRLSKPANAALAIKLAALFASGPKRQWAVLEKVSFADYLGPSRTEDADLLRAVVDCGGLGRAGEVSTRAVRAVLLGFLRGLLGQTEDPFVEFPDGPLDEVLFQPWAAYLESLGVRFHLGQRVTHLDTDGRKVTSATLVDAEGTNTSTVADWYVLSLPAERAAELLDEPLLEVDPQLRGISKLGTNWLSCIGIYLKEPVPELPNCHICLDQKWPVSAVRYSGFWDRDFSSNYGDGQAKEYISIDIPTWYEPHPVTGKAPIDHSADELVTAVLDMYRDSVPNGAQLLPDSLIHSWYVSENTNFHTDGPAKASEFMFVNTVDSWRHQPDATTAIPNLFISAAFVRTGAGLGGESMDSAAEAARLAANGILAASGAPGDPAHIPQYQEPKWLKPFTTADDVLFALSRKTFPRRVISVANSILAAWRNGRHRRAIVTTEPVGSVRAE
ncbi:FAD-dependent oxidoreductase [Mycobacteroides abscessus]|uniref:FAD-dependent oxidoreductase n=1 Tax=Mycobacteroides abscessus TaxID=36809 RepID=UPI0009C6D0B4|nr:FAD-dependent oxidoreductase [Mycobacteroides abscessus]SLG56185.1 amine oxidase [Mycobacteroides abscessus subsp. abscessus]